MTDRTHPVFDRLMLSRRLRLPLNRICMALPAERDRLLFQESRLGRCVRGMTVRTSLFSYDRPMEPVFREHLVDHCAVTTPAQFKSLLFQGKRVGRAGAFMALIAHFTARMECGVRLLASSGCIPLLKIQC